MGPKSSGRARLIQESADGPSERILTGITLIGRSAEADISLRHASVSRFHARIEARSDGFWVVDLGSSNGVFVEGVRVDGQAHLGEGLIELRFGEIPTWFEELERMAPAAPSPEPTASPTPHTTRAKPIRIAAGVAGVLLVALLVWSFTRTGARPDAIDASAPQTPEREAEPHRAPTEATPTPAAEGASDLGAEPDAATESEAAEAEPEDEVPPREQGGKPPAISLSVWRNRTLVLKSGQKLKGRLLDESDAAWLLFERRPGERPRRIARETASTYDGKAVAFDPKAALAVREAKALSTRDLTDLIAWTQSVDLPASERERLARRILEIDPRHPGATAILGRFRYLGQTLDRDALAARGALDPETGTLVGVPEDIRYLQALHIDVWGRPPLPAELEEALPESLEATVDRLLLGPEAWEEWLRAQAIRFLGTLAPHRIGAAIGDLPEDLASGGLNLSEAFAALANSAEVRASHETPEALAAIWLQVILGEGALSDAALMTAAAGMIRGERTAVLGTRGESSEELLEILLKQPNFFRRLYRLEAERTKGARPSDDEVRRAAIRLAGRPADFIALRREWLLDPARRDLLQQRRPKPVQVLIRGLYVDLLGRPPVTGEETRLFALASEFGRADLLPAILCLGVTKGAEDDPTPPTQALVRRVYRDVLGRLPTAAEAGASLRLWQEAGRLSLLQTLVTQREYLNY